MKVVADRDVASWLRALQAELFEAREQPPMSLADIVRCGEGTARDKLFDSVVAFENYPVEIERVHGMQLCEAKPKVGEPS